MVHSWCYTFCGFGHYNIIQSTFFALKILCALLIHPSLLPSTQVVWVLLYWWLWKILQATFFKKIFFPKILFLSSLYTLCRAQTHNPKGLPPSPVDLRRVLLCPNRPITKALLGRGLWSQRMLGISPIGVNKFDSNSWVLWTRSPNFTYSTLFSP